MSDNKTCDNNCSGCSEENCASRSGAQDFSEHLGKGASVKKVIGVVSGKGGVGKSLVTSLLASGINKRGYHSAILDADITGPSIPKAFGLGNDDIEVTPDRLMLPKKSLNGVDVMSTNLLLPNETDPIIWRGALIATAIKQFWGEVLWEDVDYMFVDMPPGTGDVPLTVFQSLPVDGIIIVTSPQELVSMIVAKAVKMAQKMNVPIIGLIENMSYLNCPHCNKKINVFGESHIDEIAKEYDLQVLAKLPLNPLTAELMDAGQIERAEVKEIENAIDKVEKI